MKKWMVLNKVNPSADGQKSKFKNEELIQIILENRGITKKRDIEEFLHPSLDQLNLKDLQIKEKELKKATKRIQQAIKNRESVVVYTDYDVDGLCSGAIVWETLYELGAKIMPYVPNRIEEGYGLSKKGIDGVRKKYNASLIITVDHGVSAHKNIEYAKSLGVETIIIDHHLLGSKIPKTCALVHTTKLCATGVAWIFCHYLNTKLNRKTNKFQDLDLVALATIADLVPLVGFNRTLVIYGLQQLNKTSRIGLNALIKASGLTKGELGVFEIGHILAPRINAMGRLTHAIDVLRLLCTKDRDRAKNLATLLDSTNRERQIQMNGSVFHAMRLVKNKLIIRRKEENKLIFIADENYHQGIIGLVASRLVEEFYLPAIVISKGVEYSKASARSISGFNIVEFLRKAQDLLEDVGGHPMAAGFTVRTKNILKLEKKLTGMIKEQLDKTRLAQVIKIDLEIDLSRIDKDLYEVINKLSPFGVGNPQPIFASRNVKVIGASLVGKEKQHLKLVIRSGKEFLESGVNAGNVFHAIGFGMGDLYNKISFSTPIDVVYTVDKDKWNDHFGLQLKLKDVKVQP